MLWHLLKANYQFRPSNSTECTDGAVPSLLPPPPAPAVDDDDDNDEQVLILSESACGGRVGMKGEE